MNLPPAQPPHLNRPALTAAAPAPRTAIVHEWFDSYAGSERVVEQLLKLYPDADVFGLVDHLPNSERAFLHGKTVHTSFLQKFPWVKKYFRHLLPLMPLAVEQYDLTAYDVLLSSNHAVAKGVLTRSDQLHVSYVHTPIRYAWDMQQEYLRGAKLNWGLKSALVRATLHYLRLWDRAAADRVDVFVANSKFVAGRIARAYRRAAHVVYPPVAIDKFPLSRDRGDYYVTASRLVPYKRVDVLVDAFRELPDRKLIVVGDGPELKSLRQRAPSNVEFAGRLADDALAAQVGGAKAFLFAAEEDFGISPVEAQACGTPVIAYGRGGSAETVRNGETGLHFAEQTPAAAADAVRRFERQAGNFSPERCREHAESFSESRFRGEMKDLIERAWDAFVARGRNLHPWEVDDVARHPHASTSTTNR